MGRQREERGSKKGEDAVERQRGRERGRGKKKREDAEGRQRGGERGKR